MQIHEVVTALRSPWQNAYVERFIDSSRRECLDHVIVLSDEGGPSASKRTDRSVVRHPFETPPHQPAVSVRASMPVQTDT